MRLEDKMIDKIEGLVYNSCGEIKGVNAAGAACAIVAKQEAIEFSEWIAISYVSAPGEDGMEWEDRQGVRFSSHVLYELFKQQNP